MLLHNCASYSLLPLPPLIYIRVSGLIGATYSGYYQLVAPVSLHKKNVYPVYELANAPVKLFNKDKIWRLGYQSAQGGISEAFNLVNTNMSRIPPKVGWQRIITARGSNCQGAEDCVESWFDPEKPFVLSLENSDLVPANVDIYFYPDRISWNPARITILPSLLGIRSGEYILMAEKHNGFPVYGGRGHNTFIYVGKYNIEVLNTLYIWLIGTNISDYQGQIISQPAAEDDVVSFFPASSPANWPDWTNIGSDDEIVLQQKSQRTGRNNSFLLCNKQVIKYKEAYRDKEGIVKYRDRYTPSLLLLSESDRRRCNAHPDCEEREDELDCLIFINPGIHISTGLAALVIVLSIPVFLLMRHYKLLSIEQKFQMEDCCLELKHLAMKNLVDSLAGIVLRGKKEWNQAESEYMRRAYKLLHGMSGGIKMFLHVTMAIIDQPFILHQVAVFVLEMELNLHRSNTMGPVVACWRRELGSDRVAFKIFDHISKPGCLKSATFTLRKWNLLVLQKIGFPLLRLLKSLVRLLLFNLDIIKDILLWFFLFSRFQGLQESVWIDGEFVICLIWVHGVTIINAQLLMGLYILIEADSLMEIPKDGIKKHLSRLILLPLLPFVPSLLILNVTSIQNEKEKLMIEWKTKPNMSPSSFVIRLESLEDKMKKSLNTSAMLKLIEACLECIPQLVLLLTYFTVSLFDTDALSVSKNAIQEGNPFEAIPSFQNTYPILDFIRERKIDAFFLINFLISFFTLITAIVNSINMMKRDQLGIKQKLILYISYTFQTCSRIIPIYLVIFLAIRGPLSFDYIFSRVPYPVTLSSPVALLWLFLPLAIHLPAQYLICYSTAPGFRERKIFDQILHILANLFIVIPLRTDEKEQVDKARQMEWSFILHTSEGIIILVNIFIFYPGNTWIFALFPLLGVGPLTLFLFYNNCHTFKETNKEKRDVSAWCTTLCCTWNFVLFTIGVATGVLGLWLLSLCIVGYNENVNRI